MALEDFEYETSHCIRCSNCKFAPFAQIKSMRFANQCPSITYRNFHTWSAAGRNHLALALIQGRLKEYSETMKQAVFECNMCGYCQVACRTFNYNLNPSEVLQALREHMVERGQLIPEHMAAIDGLRKEDNVFGEPKADRGKWAEGLDFLKDANTEHADVLFHVGCRTSYDEELWPIARAWARVLHAAGVDIAIAGANESCCGGRVYEMGYRGEIEKYAEDIAGIVKSCGASKIVTLCGDGYGAFKNTYPTLGTGLPCEVQHTTGLLDELIKDGRVKFNKELPIKITYHDPCHLGRKGEPGEKWEGEYKRIYPHMIAAVPEKPIKIGIEGCYDPPRNVLKAIPGIELVEMERNREFSWCCGAGGGAWEAFDDFASWTARERIEEAKSTGAGALVTACGWCERSFLDSVRGNGDDLKVYDVIELVDLAMGGS